MLSMSDIKCIKNMYIFLSLFSNLFLSILLFLISLCVYIGYKLKFWTKQRIPNLVLHNYRALTGVTAFVDQQCLQKYGKIAGFYDVLTPSLLLADPHLIDQILITNFSSFTNHRFYMPTELPIGEGLFFAKYTEWKIMKHLLSPVFSNENIKRMCSSFEQSISTLIETLKKETLVSDSIDVIGHIETCLTDSIFQTLYGLNIESLDSESSNVFAKNMKLLTLLDISFKNIIAYIFPQLSKLFKISMINENAVKYFTEIILKLLQQNALQPSRAAHYTIINRLLKGYFDEKQNEIKYLTRKQIIDNCLLFIGVGFDTTASGLYHFMYVLAKHQAIQEKLFEEIINYYSHNTDNNNVYESLNEMPYLDACLKESLRLYPPGIRTERVAASDTKLGDLFIPKNCVIVIPVYAVHRDSDNYENPDQFMPERFFAENIDKIKSGSYIPFASGPRMCIANRFASFIIKLIVVSILKEFRLMESQRNIEAHYRTGFPTLSQKNMFISFELR